MTEPADDSELLDWIAQQPSRVTADPLWRLAAYRHSAFFLTLADRDAVLIGEDSLRTDIARQLLTSATSISANIAESYGRTTPRDRLRFLSFALGSLRECMVWYDSARRVLGDEVWNARSDRLVRIRRILFGLISHVRKQLGEPIPK
jgi:four helix bundle protein